MLKIDVCSDLHVDRHEFTEDTMAKAKVPLFDFEHYRSAGSSICVIAGDVSDNLEQTIEVLADAARHYEYVVFTDGNHDNYPRQMYEGSHCDVVSNMALLSDTMHDIPNLIYLDGIVNRRWDHQGVAFIGANSWYDWKCFEHRGVSFPMAFGSWDDNSSDAKIDFGEYGYPNSLGAVQAVNLREEMIRISKDNSIKQTVVVTHSAPMGSLLNWIDGDDPKDVRYNLWTPSFCNTELASVFDFDYGEKIRLWVYGHTHTRATTQRGKALLVNNSFGYPSETSGRNWSMANFEVR